LLRDRERQEMFATRARDNSCLVAFCNSVGGRDELLFNGNSLVLDEEGHLLARGPSFEEALLVVDIEPADAIGGGARGGPRSGAGRASRGRPWSSTSSRPTRSGAGSETSAAGLSPATAASSLTYRPSMSAPRMGTRGGWRRRARG